jgi:1,4-alpha-glucan branching enzyme
MPVAEFAGDYSWGYNPAQPFAVENIGYGGPDGLKTFVLACHQRGIAVFLDVVHNHYGSSDLDMWNFDGWAQGTPTNSVGGGGIYFYETDFNLQNTPYAATRPNFNSNQVNSFIQDNFSMWLNECHVDGFRWDTPYTMTHGFDGTTYIPAAGNLISTINTMIHTNTGKISIAEDVYNYWGFDSAWDTGYPGSFMPQLATNSDSSRNMNTVASDVQYNVNYGGSASYLRVVYLESHDVAGNNVRLVTAIDPATPNSYRARKLSTLGAAVTLTAPGVPMIFQGQEMLENQKFSLNNTPAVDWSKTNTYKGIVQLYRDLITARRDLKGYTPGLKGDQCGMLWVDNGSKLVAFHRWKSGTTNQDAVVIGNFGNTNYPVYNLTFPYAGTWYVHFNSDSTNYSSDFGNNGSTLVTASGSPPMASVAIGPYSALILSATPEAPPLLTASQMNGNVIVSWPNTYSEWVLDSCPALAGSSTVWSQVPAGQYQNGANTIFISIPASSGPAFYRLRKS